MRTWSFSIVFTLSYAAINLKLYRVYVVFKRGVADGTSGKRVANEILLRVLLYIILFEIILLSAFYFLDPETAGPVTTHFSNIFQVENIECIQSTLWQSAIVATWKLFTTGVAVYLANETKGLPSPNLSESAQIQDCTIEAVIGYGFYLVMATIVDSYAAKTALRTVCISIIAVNGSTKIFRPKVSLAR